MGYRNWHPQGAVGRDIQEFIQLQPRDKEQRQGLGLGLYIVKRLCILLGHPIEVRSRVNRGTRFEIRVPLTQTVQPTPAATRADQPFLDKKFILVLDDDLIIVRALTGLLEGWGARVYGTSTVDELLAASAGFDRCPDLILSDFHLQGSHNQRADVLDGIASVARLRDEFAHNIPALLITGESDPARLRQAKSSGLLVLHKPLKAETLAAHLGTLFGYQPAARAASTA